MVTFRARLLFVFLLVAAPLTVEAVPRPPPITDKDFIGCARELHIALNNNPSISAIRITMVAPRNKMREFHLDFYEYENLSKPRQKPPRVCRQ